MTGQYILNDGVPVPAPSLVAWANWIGVNDRTIARTEVGEVTVSTVFLGLDHNFFGGTPLLFETLVFGGEHADDMERYATLDEARRGHDRMVALIRGEA